MSTRDVITFATVDGDEAWARVSGEGGRVRLVVSLEANGDYDVLLDRSAARRLGEALIDAAGGQG